ncbi:MAG: ABC transporter ATP-binding protein [Chloroflexi bacterium]|nr:MAG: ABC transporter ATP-binding protein [Chloroflexota bacterium]
MALLTASYLSQSFGATDIFSGISLSIPKDGKIGLVGPNGVGKTTLLLILAGLSAPAAGTVQLVRGCRIGYLPQESSQAFANNEHTVYEEMLAVFADLRQEEARLRAVEAQMAEGVFSEELLAQYSRMQEAFELAGGYTYEVRIRQVLTGLGFSEEDWQLPLVHLSGGQKTRVLLARLLLEQPDLLILDEPTNHLDVEAIEWLEGALRMWPGAVLVVSHDRYFLDRVVNTIWEMSGTGLQVYRGNYTAYLEQRRARWALQMRAYEEFRQHVEKEMDYIRRNIAGQRTQMAQGKLSRLAREVAAVLAGGLEALDVVRGRGWLQLTTEVELGRVATTVGELQEQIRLLRPPKRPSLLQMSLSTSRRSGDLVLRTKDLQVGYPNKVLFVAEDIELRRGECAALIGGNGSGKTTFLKTILGELPPLAGEIRLGASLDIGYFAQARVDLEPDKTVLDTILDASNLLPGEARNYLAGFLFRGDDVYKQIRALSGGERGRLALALLALQDVNFLLLDEPTNHLDIPAQEALQEALESFAGTVLLVTHDRYLVARLATQIWVVENGRLRVYPFGYEDYLEMRAAEKEQQQETAVAQSDSSANGRSRQSANGLSKNEQRRRATALAELENQIETLEMRLQELTEAIQVATQRDDFDKIQSLSVEYAATEAELDNLMTAWEKLAHE